MAPTILIIGSGPGIGQAVGRVFAQRRYTNVALVARSSAQLAIDKAAVETAAANANRSVTVRTWSVDVTQTKDLQRVLKEVESFGLLETVYYNAARIQRGEILKVESDDILYDLKVGHSIFPL
jgi:NAD(P)-dependent dehydrogenase (short-subunit alcohol dehydrogenase family)